MSATHSAPWPRPPWWTRHIRALERTMGTIIALALAVQAITVSQTGWPWGGWTAVLIGAAALGTVFRYPKVALGLFAAAPLIATLGGADPITSWTIACFGALLLTLRGTSALWVAGLLSMTNLLAAGIARGTLLPTENTEPSIAAGAAIMMAAAGAALHANRRYWTQLKARAKDASVTREAAIDRGIAEERLRIARDLHDSVGHRIAVVSMHLGAAEVHLPEGAAAARADLERARTGVQSVLLETQQILRVLRVGPDTDALAPTPDYAQLPDLVESFRSAGLEIEASVANINGTVPQEVRTAAFRIVQEALTNAQKHGSGPVSLAVDLGPKQLTVNVVNMRHPSDPGPRAPGGSGIVGMRERAASAGGTLEVSADDTLYWLRAELPIPNGDIP